MTNFAKDYAVVSSAMYPASPLDSNGFSRLDAHFADNPPPTRGRPRRRCRSARAAAAAHRFIRNPLPFLGRYIFLCSP
jgi:hypothetical protein